MSDLLRRIQHAQIHAAEQEVIRHLDEIEGNEQQHTEAEQIAALTQEVERLRKIETLARAIANEWRQGNEPAAQMFRDLCAATAKGPTP